MMIIFILEELKDFLRTGWEVTGARKKKVTPTLLKIFDGFDSPGK